MSEEFETEPSRFQKPGDEEPDHCFPRGNHGSLVLSPEAAAAWYKRHGRVAPCNVCGYCTIHFDDGCRECNEVIVIDYTKGGKSHSE